MAGMRSRWRRLSPPRPSGTASPPPSWTRPAAATTGSAALQGPAAATAVAACKRNFRRAAIAEPTWPLHFSCFAAEEAREAAVQLVDLAVQARPHQDDLPLLPARYHVFARALEGFAFARVARPTAMVACGCFWVATKPALIGGAAVFTGDLRPPVAWPMSSARWNQSSGPANELPAAP